ncbi:hypothetical protein [Pseudokineococcus sp. 1T1Z-3]|uniref:hypothetical protein n=1 Tax=Pseudokineococcus sp. 1T1Z-3 TaxID=3132745 RepID=UPI0030A636F3
MSETTTYGRGADRRRYREGADRLTIVSGTLTGQRLGVVVRSGWATSMQALKTVQSEVFPAEHDRWIAVIDDHDFPTEASSPHEVLSAVRSTVRKVLGWDDVAVKLLECAGCPWRPSDASA